LLRALAVLRKRVPNARLVIAGDGPEAPRLKALAGDLDVADGVTWLGNVDRADILYWMRNATLFLLLSEYEGQSHVLLEAMTEGLPVVVSANGGNLELISNNRNGIVVDPADQLQVATIVEELLADPEKRGRIAAAAREGLQNHAWDMLMHRTQAVFRAVETERG
jgi:phosphatidylinositol alpha-1,6-mannosyltransferase